jgi:hypothetical protein
MKILKRTPMKTRRTHFWSSLLVLSATLASTTIKGQGTINFDAHPNWIGTYYVESEMTFQLFVPQGASSDYMGIVPPFTYQGVPQNNTSFMWWFRQNNPYNYVSLSLTDGSLFGLASVDLADPVSPSLSPVAISFIGHLAGGSTMTNTFTTPGNGATTFEAYTFNPEFASQVFTHVDIFAPKWAMDNLVFTVPEPSLFALFGLGALALVGRRLLGHRGVSVDAAGKVWVGNTARTTPCELIRRPGHWR